MNFLTSQYEFLLLFHWVFETITGAESEDSE